MKRTERHKLKQNEFARTVAHAREVLESRGADLTKAVVAVLVVAGVLAGYLWWRGSREARANALLASALATYEMPVVPPAPPEPGSPPPVPQPGTFQTQQERLDASLPKFLEAADAHPDRQAGITARYHAAAILAAQGKHADAERQFQQVVERARGSIYWWTARLGLAQTQVAQGKYDSAIEIYTELSRETNSSLPLDGILLHLARAQLRAGKKEDAVRSFTRIVDEFPQSSYATDARREMEEAKKS